MRANSGETLAAGAAPDTASEKEREAELVDAMTAKNHYSTYYGYLGVVMCGWGYV